MGGRDRLCLRGLERVVVARRVALTLAAAVLRRGLRGQLQGSLQPLPLPRQELQLVRQLLDVRHHLVATGLLQYA